MSGVRLLGALTLLVAGAGTAVAAVAVHTLWWGLPLVIGALVSTLAAVGPGWSTRLPLAVGFAAGVAVLVLPQPEGGYLVAVGGEGWALLLAGLLAPGWAIVTLPPPRRRRGPGGVAESAGAGPRT